LPQGEPFKQQPAKPHQLREKLGACLERSQFHKLPVALELAQLVKQLKSKAWEPARKLQPAWQAALLEQLHLALCNG
jgi:hypothetical protein